MLATVSVLLLLTTWDCDTGKMLEQSTRVFAKTSLNNDTIEDCRLFGVEAARYLTRKYRAAGHPNSSTNVDCQWQQGSPT